MTTTSSPLFFPQVFNEPGSRRALRLIHNLTDRDFSWLSHIKFLTHQRRQEQTSPMRADKLSINMKDRVAVPLAGCFMLSPTPEGAGAILYTPFWGIEKFHNIEAILARLILRLKKPGDKDELLRYASLSQRLGWSDESVIGVTHEVIQGDVFEEQEALIKDNYQHNKQLLMEELNQLPSLTDVLNEVFDDVLATTFPGLHQRDTHVSFSTDLPTDRRSETTMSLCDALLRYYRDQGWRADPPLKFTNPKYTPEHNDPAQVARDNKQWQRAIETVSNGLGRLLGERLLAYWDHVMPNGESRRKLFIQAISDNARADILFKRQKEIITPEQSIALNVLFDRSSPVSTQVPMVPETIRLWEYAANFIELAGSFMITFPDAYLFTPTSGLQLLQNKADLQHVMRSKFIAAGHNDELYELLTHEERNRFIGFTHPQVSGEPITGSVFDTLFDGIVEKQVRNVEYALGVYRHSDGVLNVRALFDKALDVRSMIDEQLSKFPTQGRWSTSPIITGQRRPSIVLAEKAVIASKSFVSVSSAIEAEWLTQPDATQALQRRFLEAMKGNLAHAMAVGIRGEAGLRVLNGTLSEADRSIVDTVLNPDNPLRLTREAFKGFRPDAYGISLETAGRTSSLALAHCFLLTERGGLDIVHSGRAILFTPAVGLESFESVSAVRNELQRRLLDPVKRLTLLENLLPSERLFHTAYTLGHFRLIDASLLLNVQQSGIEHFLARCEHVRTLNLTGPKQTKALEVLKRQPAFTNLQRADNIGKAIATQQTLDAWLGKASFDEQQRHVELMQQYCNSVPDEKDYLHGLQTLSGYVHEQLISLQKTRYNGAFIDPNHVRVTPSLAIAGPAQSLTEFALNHVNVLQDTSFTLASTTSQALPTGMNTQAVRQMLLLLNIKSVYQQMLSAQLSDDNEEACARKLRYFQQLPWQLLQEAHMLKMQEQLSEKTFDAIQQLLDMPDATARAAVNGATAIIRPLGLISNEGAAAVETLGIYLISPGEASAGPHALYAPYYVGQPFTEFDSEADVLAALNTPGPLQDLLLRRLPESSQVTFENLFKTTVGTTTEITLASNPVTGNVMERLFQDNILLLKQMIGSQSVVTAQSDWEKAKELFSSGIKLVTGFLPGKLSCGLFLWEAYKDFKDSAEALQSHHWKHAFKAFIHGVAQMIPIGRTLQAISASTAEAIPSSGPPEVQPVSAPQWSAINITAALRTNAQQYEAPTVDLQKFQKNSAEGTYRDPVTRNHYAPVLGKIYRVEKQSGAWRMRNETQAGPILEAAPGSHLVPAADTHSIHYLTSLSTLANRYGVRSVVRSALNVEASGMPAIHRLYPARAQMIVDALEMARTYAFNSLHNLSVLPVNAPGTRLDTFFKTFFSVSAVDTALLDKIKNTIIPLCNALVDPALDELDNNRFVVGSNVDMSDRLVAFVVEKDLQKRVHFTEKFFDPQLDLYKFCLTTPFDVDTHARASTLIHEFSHQFSKTIDLAYLEARRPFSDLIATVTRLGVELKDAQETFQNEALSMTTPRQELFARWNSELGYWENLGDSLDTRHLGKHITKITGTRSVDEARRAFLDRVSPTARIDTILSNADSVARLVCEMGRQLDPVPVAP